MDRQAIYEYLTKIPYGKVTTYKHIAQKILNSSKGGRNDYEKQRPSW